MINHSIFSYTEAVDQSEFSEDFHDQSQIATTTLEQRQSGALVSTSIGQMFESVVFQTKAHFQACQLAVLSSEWQTLFTADQVSLEDPSGILALSNTNVTDVTGSIADRGTGKQLKVLPIAGAPFDETGIFDDSGDSYDEVDSYTVESGEYGVNTDLALCEFPAVSTGDDFDTASDYDEAGVFDDLPAYRLRLSAVARVYLPETNRGEYEIRLRGPGGTLLARKKYKLPASQWVELELPYISNTTDKSFQAEVVQTSTATREPFILAMLCVFYHPFVWELSNDGGTSWIDVVTGINDPNASFVFPAKGNQLVLRAVASHAGASISAYVVVPWYLEGYSAVRTPIFREGERGVSDLNAQRDVSSKSMFKLWSRDFPREYSIQQPGAVLS